MDEDTKEMVQIKDQEKSSIAVAFKKNLTEHHPLVVIAGKISS
jgi:hypothetical protein